MSLRSGNAATQQGSLRPFGLRYALWGALLAMLIVTVAFAPAAPSLAQTGQLGVNIPEAVDFDPGGQMFTDLMKQARRFGSPGTPWDESASIDANGWPNGDAGAVVLLGNAGAITGTYKLTFTGNAAVAPVACNFTVQNKVYTPETNVTTADIVVGASETQIILAFTGQAGGVKNVRLIRPGYPADGSTLFTTPYLNALQYFTVLRGMDWLNTNSNNPPYGQTTIWANRKLPTDATQASTAEKKGACFEYLIQLANQTGKDIWVNVPFAADDNYITQMATLLKSNLNSSRVVYVEYSNEVWNYGFQQAQNNKQATQDEVNAGSTNLRYDGENDIYRLSCRRYSRRTTQIAQIFRIVYGSQFTSRVRPVLAWQTGSADYFVADSLKFIQMNYETPSNLIYAIASAPYMELDEANSGSVSSILSNWNSTSDTNNKTNNQQYKAVANTYSLHYVSYEGGTSEQQGTNNLTPKLAANRDAGVTPIIVKDIRTNFWGQGGELYMYFNLAGNYGQYGCWGLTEDINNLNTPKFDAIRQLVGAVVPGAPTGLSATAGNGQIGLTWNAVSGATSYNVYRGTTAGGESTTAIATGITGTSYTNSGLTNGTTYYYKVKAVNANGASGYSNEAGATPTGGGGGTTLPLQINAGGGAASPYIADAYFSGGTAFVNGTGAIDVSGVTNPAPQAVYQAERYGASTYTIPGLTAGTSHTVRLHFAENYFTSANQRKFNVAINGASVLSEFDVYAAAGATRKAVVRQFTATANGSGQIVIAFTNGSANNALINGVEILAGGGSPPSAPTGLSATAGNAQVALSWTASTGATSYNVKRSTTSGGPYTTVASPTGTSYTNTGLTNGTTYYYIVTAVNANGESGASSQVSARPKAPGVKVNAGGGAASPYLADQYFSGGTAFTNWTGAIDTSGVSSPAPAAVYQSERYGASTYTIPNLTAGASYTVRLHFTENYFTASGQRLFNAAINGSSVLSEFDVYAAAGAIHKAVVRQFPATANASGQIVIALTNGTQNNALINGIEIN